MCSGTTSGPIFNLLRCPLFLCSILLPTTGLLRDCPTPDFPSLLSSSGPEALTFPRRLSFPLQEIPSSTLYPLDPYPNFPTFCCSPFFSFESGIRGPGQGPLCSFVRASFSPPKCSLRPSFVCPVIPLLSYNSGKKNRNLKKKMCSR